MFFFQLSCANEVCNYDNETPDWFSQDPWKWFSGNANKFGFTVGANVCRCQTSEWAVDTNIFVMLELGLEFKVSALTEGGDAELFTKFESLQWDKLCLDTEDFSYDLIDGRLAEFGYMSFYFGEEEAPDGHPLVLRLDCTASFLFLYF
jgi:hypothetical protein